MFANSNNNTYKNTLLFYCLTEKLFQHFVHKELTQCQQTNHLLHQCMPFPIWPLDTQSRSLPPPSQTKHPAHHCNSLASKCPAANRSVRGQERATKKA